MSNADTLLMWFSHNDNGCRTWQAEEGFLRRSLLGVSGCLGVQLGVTPSLSLPDTLVRQVMVNETASQGCNLVAHSHQLPFPACSAEAVVLPHTLSLAKKPHQTLNEVHRILVPEGRLVLTEFNPFSLWGVAGVFDGKALPKWRNTISLCRLEDWLGVLGFYVGKAEFMQYTPWLNHGNALEKLSFMNAVGSKCWPQAGAVYGLTAVKRTVAVHPLLERRPLRLVSAPAPILQPNKNPAASSVASE